MEDVSSSRAGCGLGVEADFPSVGADSRFPSLPAQSGGSSSSSFIPYSKSKGLTEEGLASLGYDETIIFRPGMLVVPGGRPDHRLMESIAA